MRRTLSPAMTFAVTGIALLTLAASGCQNAGLSKLSRPSWLAWKRDKSTSTTLASTSPSTTLPSATATPKPPVVSGIAASTPGSAGGYAGPQYPPQTGSNVAYPAPTGGSPGATGYPTGPYPTGVAPAVAPTANGGYTPPWSGATGPQKGFYSGNPNSSATVNPGGVYAADRRYNGADSRYNGADSRYNGAPGAANRSRYDTPYPPNPPAGSPPPYGGYAPPAVSPATDGSGASGTNVPGGYSESNPSSRYGGPTEPVNTPNGYTSNADQAPTGFPPQNQSTGGYSYGEVSPAGGQNATNAYESPASGSSYSDSSNSYAPPVSNPPPTADAQPWRPGSTTGLPQGPAAGGSAPRTGNQAPVGNTVQPATYGADPSYSPAQYQPPANASPSHGSYPSSGTPDGGYGY